MVFKNITRIKSALPEVLHIVMFYNNGTVFQTTFEQEINIPKLGENLAELINHIRRVYDLCKFRIDAYKKLIFETEDISIILLKLGEESNIALFFKKEEDKELKLTAIKRYITRIEELIDMDEKEIVLHEILVIEEEQKNLNVFLHGKEQDLKQLKEKIDLLDKEEFLEQVKEKEKELKSKEEEIIKLKKDLDNSTKEILRLRELIEKDINHSSL
ncbi:MAG: hypothetical protein ACFFEY_11190 [Candidatus Thorarchaeota archaeon]